MFHPSVFLFSGVFIIMETYSNQLKSPKWQKKRLEIFKRDKFKCRLCSDKETTLNVHHLEYTDGLFAWEYENSKLITLCEHCHNEITELLKFYKFDVLKCKVKKTYSVNMNDVILFTVIDNKTLFFSSYDKLRGYKTKLFRYAFENSDINNLKSLIKNIR